MADLHFRDLTSDRFLEELTAKVNAQKPDLILLGGDLLEGDRRSEDTGRYERAFRAMTSTYGIYGAPGNHERFSRVGTNAFLERAGIRLLQDEAVPIDDALILAGRKDARSRNRKPVAEVLSSARRDLPVVLIAHRPTGFDEARLAGVDIQLSGHTHHGQLFPVNFVTQTTNTTSAGVISKGTERISSSPAASKAGARRSGPLGPFGESSSSASRSAPASKKRKRTATGRG